MLIAILANHSPKDRGPAGQFVAADAFKDRRPVVDNVRHHMNGRVVPVHQLAVVLDLLGLLDCHANSLEVVIANIIADALPAPRTLATLTSDAADALPKRNQFTFQ
jgi:hypothetical protein